MAFWNFARSILRLPGEGTSEVDFFEFCQLNPELRIKRNALK